MEDEELGYGEVLVTDGQQRGRIGYYDDDGSDEEDVECGIVYFGPMFLGAPYDEIPHGFFRRANTTDLIVRIDEIYRLIGLGCETGLNIEERYDLLLEKNYIDGVLVNNYVEARFGSSGGFKGKRVFLSHSSEDKWFVNRLATDLTRLQIDPWLDAWKIRAGESIPQKISNGIEAAHCVVVILSSNAVSSKWVEREWQSKYWDEVNRNETLVIPVLLEDCELPQLLKGKKYIDFRKGYQEGLDELLLVIPQQVGDENI